MSGILLGECPTLVSIAGDCAGETSAEPLLWNAPTSVEAAPAIASTND